MSANVQVLLARRPTGLPAEDDFRIVETPVPRPADGELLVRNHYLSLDPYMRLRMNAVKSYARYVELGEVMVGGAVGEVIESRNPKFRTGEFVTGALGWQLYAVSDGAALRKVDPRAAPLSHYLGVLGMPGVTAWIGLLDIAQPKAGETVVVSAASGAVGSVVGQLAKRRGCRAVGIAGGPEKCRYVVETLGFDACVDYRAHPDLKSLSGALKAACPDGIDGNFENVGGVTLDAVLQRMNAFGRIALCGMISGYDGAPIPLLQPQLLLVSRLKLQGFIVSEHMALWPEALAELGALVARGELKYRESIAHGIDAAPQAFLDLLGGKNFGKQLVKLV